MPMDKRGQYDRTRFKGPKPETIARMGRIIALRQAGRSFQSIADEMGLSKQRVHAIATRRPDGSRYAQPRKGEA